MQSPDLVTASVKPWALSYQKGTEMLSQQPFILLVEDDADLRNMIARGLQATGYMVFQAGNFSQALDEMAIKPNLMILDINLPDATGWDVAELARDH